MTLSLHCLAPQLQLLIYLAWFRSLFACMVLEINCHEGQSPGARKPQEAMVGHVSQRGKSMECPKWLQIQSSEVESEAD